MYQEAGGGVGGMPGGMGGGGGGMPGGMAGGMGGDAGSGNRGPTIEEHMTTSKHFPILPSASSAVERVFEFDRSLNNQAPSVCRVPLSTFTDAPFGMLGHANVPMKSAIFFLTVKCIKAFGRQHRCSRWPHPTRLTGWCHRQHSRHTLHLIWRKQLKTEWLDELCVKQSLIGLVGKAR
ncbi:hypothetical protein TcWFU_004558 [Taenia crassiceps]|uniref:Uncharacterized protein n=1 Tax=Taenia crassiceps TaxID=6207 RepID=A0ABR4QKV3_9CEST